MPVKTALRNQLTILVSLVLIFIVALFGIALSQLEQPVTSFTWLCFIGGVAAALIGALLVFQRLHYCLYVPAKLLAQQLEVLGKETTKPIHVPIRHEELSWIRQAIAHESERLITQQNALNHGTSELAALEQELRSIASHLTEGIHEQSQRTDQVATAMEEMSAAAQEVAGHTLKASQAADDAERATQDGEAAMMDMVASINNIRDEITTTSEVIGQLAFDSGRIGEVLAVIHSIAEQTNLLALNAAIEAARAGESGRGFAVVADEVRNLAQRTAQSTNEINNIITVVQKGAERAVEAIESGRASSEKGVEQVQMAGQILNGVTDAVQTIRDMNRQIATAAEEQTLVAVDISRNLTELVQIASNNQHSSVRTQSASNALAEICTKLYKI